MTTPLPPVLCHTQDMDEQYTADQLKAYGAAEYKRAIEDAARLVKEQMSGMFGGSMGMVTLIRKIGATP